MIKLQKLVQGIWITVMRADTHEEAERQACVHYMADTSGQYRFTDKGGKVIKPCTEYGQQMMLDVFKMKVWDLIAQADKCGVVITIDTVPQQPLAMRNYKMVPHVRLLR